MLIVTDIDECVLGWANGFTEYLIYKGYSVNTNWERYDNIEEWLDDNNLEFNLIYEFNKDKRFSELNPTKKSDIFVPLLHDMGNTFVGLTACGTGVTTKKYRRDNIEKLFPDIFKTIIFVNSGYEKKDYLSILNGDIWIEDNYQNAYLGTNLNYQTFIIDYNHNKKFDCEHINRVNDWEEIYSRIV